MKESNRLIIQKLKKKVVVICLYADDTLIFGTNLQEMDKTKNFLSAKLSMKDMGQEDVNLEIKIIRNDDGMLLTQSHYKERVLE